MATTDASLPNVKSSVVNPDYVMNPGLFPGSEIRYLFRIRIQAKIKKSLILLHINCAANKWNAPLTVD